MLCKALLFLLLNLAYAGDDAEPIETPPDSAEYQRLSQEIEKLATRNAWGGVERAYLAAVSTRMPLSFEDHLAGASAAQSRGDVTTARKRLILANELKEDAATLDWLWDIDSSYGQVFLAADPGKVALSAKEMPFNPSLANAVQFAIDEVERTGSFDGFLPQGTYTFSGIDVRVMPRVQGVRIDLRSDDYERKLLKWEKRQARKNKKNGEEV